MAKKQTRRSISVSRTTYERLKAFCETNSISMSQLVETRVNDFLGTSDLAPMTAPSTQSVVSAAVTTAARLGQAAPRLTTPSAQPTRPIDSRPRQLSTGSAPGSATGSSVGSAAGSATGSPPGSASASGPAHPAPMTSAAARFAVEPPPPIIKPRPDTAAPKPAEKRPEQIFTF